MNIVLMSDVATINGGAAKIALDGARALTTAGHQVHLVYGAGPVSESLHGIRGLTIHRIGEFDIVDDPNRLRAMAYGWWNPQARNYVGKLLDSLDRRETVVHVHSWTKALSSSAVRAALDRNFQTVFTLHDFLIACPTGTLFLQNTLQKCAIKPMSLKCICTNCDPHSYQHKLWRVGRRAVQEYKGHIPAGVRHFIVCSRMAQDLLAPYVSDEAIFHFVQNPIEMRQEPPCAVELNDTFLSVGRLTPEKGVELFARAAAQANVPCRFVGEGSSRESISIANPKAVLSGWMNHDDALAALLTARALVFSSLWYETLGLVVLEAAGMGIPSVVPDSCAARESVVDGVTGLYFKSGDQIDLQAKLTVLKDPVLAAKMGRAAYQRFWSPPGWNLKLHATRLLDTYQTMLHSNEGVLDRAQRQYASV